MKEFSFSAIFASIGTTATALIGGWDLLIQALLLFMILDYITGLWAAFRQKKVNSEVMWYGGIRKFFIFVPIIVATMLDLLISDNQPVCRTIVIYFYISREGISILENLGKIGVPLPIKLRSVLEQLKPEETEDGRGGKKRGR